MSLKFYLAHRRLFEISIVTAILLLIVVVNVSTLGIEHMRNGTGPGWGEAWATEITSVGAAGVIIPLIFYVLQQLDVKPQNIFQKVVILLTVFIFSSLLHIALFVFIRKALWASVGEQYSFDPLLLNLIYEMRKDFMGFAGIVAAFYSYRFIIDRLQGEARFIDKGEHSNQQQYRSQFLVKMLGREFLLKVDDIDWIQSASNYVVLNCGARYYPMRRTLKRLAEELDPDKFQRVHRTAIVNLKRVEGLRDKGESEVFLTTGVAVPVSKTYLPQLRASLSSMGLLQD